MTVAALSSLHLPRRRVRGRAALRGRRRRRARADRARVPDRARVRRARRVRRAARRARARRSRASSRVFFVFLFLSSQALPRPLIEQDWFRTIATWNPVSYMLEGIRSVVITGWDGEALARGFGVRDRALRDRHLRRLARAADEAGADMRRFWSRRARRRLAPDPQLHPQPGLPAAVDHLPAVLLHRVRGRALERRQRARASTSRPATRRSSSCSCCCSRRRSAASSPASASRPTSSAASRGG